MGNIAFSTATVGIMTLQAGRMITTLSEYDKLLLSTVITSDQTLVTSALDKDIGEHHGSE